MLCVSVNSQGFLQKSNQDIELCNSYILVSKSDYDYWFDFVSVSPADVTTAFSFGFAAVLGIGFLASYPIKIALNLIRKI